VLHAGITNVALTHNAGMVPVAVTPVANATPDTIGITWRGDWLEPAGADGWVPSTAQNPLPPLPGIPLLGGENTTSLIGSKFSKLNSATAEIGIDIYEFLRRERNPISSGPSAIRNRIQVLRTALTHRRNALQYMLAGVLSMQISRGVRNSADVQLAGELFHTSASLLFEGERRKDKSDWVFELTAIIAEMSADMYAEAGNLAIESGKGLARSISAQLHTAEDDSNVSQDLAAFRMKEAADAASRFGEGTLSHNQLFQLERDSRSLAARAWSGAYALHGESHAAARGLWNAWAGRDLKTYAELSVAAANFYDPYHNEERSHESFEDSATSTEYLFRAAWAASRRGLDAADWQLASNSLLKAQSSGHEVNVLRVGDDDHTEYDTDRLGSLRDDAGEIFLKWRQDIDLNAGRAKAWLKILDGRTDTRRELTDNEARVAKKFAVMDKPAEMADMSLTFPWLTIEKSEAYEYDRLLGIAAAAGDADNKLVGYTAILEAGIRKTLEMQRNKADDWEDWRTTEMTLREKLELAERLVRDLQN